MGTNQVKTIMANWKLEQKEGFAWLTYEEDNATKQKCIGMVSLDGKIVFPPKQPEVRDHFVKVTGSDPDKHIFT
jgi:hypothetical protein